MSQSLKFSTFLVGALASSLAMWAMPSSAATFLVTKNFWGNHTTPGTFSWAIDQSNSNPGRDAIELTTDVSIDDYLAGAHGPSQYAAHITDLSGLEIWGNGHNLTGDPSFINTSGTLHTKTNPAAFRPGDVLLDQAASFATVSDNVSLLSIDALNLDGLNEFLNIGKGSNVLIRNSSIKNMGAFGKPPREALDNPADLRDDSLVIAGLVRVHGRQAARIR